jgi:glycosyltransferase involved in cell wall biosynthesis
MNQQKLRILFISSWFPNKVHPFLGNFVEKHANAVALYCNVMLIHAVFSDSVSGKRYEFDCKKENSIQIVRIYISRKYTKIFLLGGFIKFLYYLKAYLDGYHYMIKQFGRPDIVHANILYPVSWIALLMNVKFKIPFVLTEHWTAYMPDDPNTPGFFQIFLSRIAAWKAKKITVVSADLQKAMVSCHIKGNYEIINNVVDLHIFKPNPEKIQNNKTRFIHISSLDDTQKNVSGILKAVNQLSLIRNDFELYIVGDGDASPYIQLAKDLHIYQSFVYFNGPQKTEEIVLSLQNSDCLLMFSNYESFSVVIAEALACGIPVIASRCGGLVNELSDEHGIFITPNDNAALVDAMNAMIEHHLDFDSLKLTEFASRYSFENVGKSFLNIYKNIIHQN